MANGKDEKNNPKRRVSKEAKGMTTFDMGGGATVQRMLSPEAQRDLEAQKEYPTDYATPDELELYPDDYDGGDY